MFHSFSVLSFSPIIQANTPGRWYPDLESGRQCFISYQQPRVAGADQGSWEDQQDHRSEKLKKRKTKDYRSEYQSLEIILRKKLQTLMVVMWGRKSLWIQSQEMLLLIIIKESVVGVRGIAQFVLYTAPRFNPSHPWALPGLILNVEQRINPEHRWVWHKTEKERKLKKRKRGCCQWTRLEFTYLFVQYLGMKPMFHAFKT